MQVYEEDPEYSLETQQALLSFMEASSLEEMAQLTAKFPFMTDLDDFVLGLEEDLQPAVPQENLQDFKERLAWLKQIATEKHSKS